MPGKRGRALPAGMHHFHCSGYVCWLGSYLKYGTIWSTLYLRLVWVLCHVLDVTFVVDATYYFVLSNSDKWHSPHPSPRDRWEPCSRRSERGITLGAHQCSRSLCQGKDGELSLRRCITSTAVARTPARLPHFLHFKTFVLYLIKVFGRFIGYLFAPILRILPSLQKSPSFEWRVCGLEWKKVKMVFSLFEGLHWK